MNEETWGGNDTGEGPLDVAVNPSLLQRFLTSKTLTPSTLKSDSSNPLNVLYTDIKMRS